MKFKSFLAKPFASYIYKGIRKSMRTALEDQDTVLRQLLKTGKTTEFGQDHQLAEVNSHQEFREAIPLRALSIA